MPKGIRRTRFHLSSLPGVLFNTEGEPGGGGGSNEPPAPPDGGQETPPNEPGNPEELGDKGKQAIDRMKAERNEAAKRAKDLERQLNEIREANQTEQEKALGAARKEGAAEAAKALAPKLVAAEFKAASAGRLTADQLSGFLEDLDLTKYLTADGEVDAERVAKKVDLLAPAQEPRTPSFNGGARTPEKQRAGSLGEAIANRMAKKS